MPLDQADGLRRLFAQSRVRVLDDGFAYRMAEQRLNRCGHHLPAALCEAG